MGESSLSLASSGTKKKKRNVFKRIGRGISRKKKKNKPDDESVSAVSLDRQASGAAPRSVALSNDGGSSSATSGNSSAGRTASSAGRTAIAKPIQVVLLLMDPSTRRFELLQLEFDSNKAMVSDVLKQIQRSATETTLRDTKYVGVSDQNGVEMISSVKLSVFCQGNDIVLAIPNGMTAKDTAKLAAPILGDQKVEDMLVPVGAQVRPKSAKKMGGSTKLTRIAEEDIRRKEKTASSSPQKANSRSGSGGGKPSEKRGCRTLPTVILGVIISSLLYFAVQRHIRVTKPLDSGDALLRGQWKSQCGIFDLFPQDWLRKMPMDKLSRSCNMQSSSMLELGRDGTLRYFTKGDNGEREERWSVAGGDNVEDQCAEGGQDEQCNDAGAKFVKDGNNWYVEMGPSRTDLSKDFIRDFTTESQV